MLSEMGRRLRDAAQAAGLSLRELGDMMGVSRPTIYAYASGALRMSPRRLRQAAEITGKPVEYFAPRKVSDLDPSSPAAQTIRLIDALMAPPSPACATEIAKEALAAQSHSDSPGVKAEILLKLGTSLARTGDYVGAVRHLESAYNIFIGEDASEQTGSCLQTLGFCYLGLGQVDRAREAFVGALELHPTEKKWLAQIALAALSERVGEYKAAEVMLSDMLDDPELSDSALTYVRANYASNLCARGMWRSGLAQTETALNSAYQTSANDQVIEMLVQSAQGLAYTGRLEEAVIAIIRAKDISFAVKDEARKTLAEAMIGLVLMAHGNDDAAREKVNQAYTSALRGQYRRTESLCLQLLAELALNRKDYTSARESATQLQSHSQAHQMMGPRALGYIFESSALIRLGKPTEAKHAIERAKEIVEGIGDGRIQMLLSQAEYDLAVALNQPEGAEKAYVAVLDQIDKFGLEFDRKIFLSRISSDVANEGAEGDMVSSGLSLWKVLLSGGASDSSSDFEHGDN